jgi:hypothetical protein
MVTRKPPVNDLDTTDLEFRQLQDHYDRLVELVVCLGASCSNCMYARPGPMCRKFMPDGSVVEVRSDFVCGYWIGNPKRPRGADATL